MSQPEDQNQCITAHGRVASHTRVRLQAHIWQYKLRIVLAASAPWASLTIESSHQTKHNESAIPTYGDNVDEADESWAATAAATAAAAEAPTKAAGGAMAGGTGGPVRGRETRQMVRHGQTVGRQALTPEDLRRLG